MKGVTGMNAHTKRKYLWIAIAVPLALSVSPLFGQNQVMGEVDFKGATKVEKTSGVWVDGQYVGYLKELKGSKKIMLLPGEHELSVRQAGYNDLTKKVIVEPRLILTVHVRMEKATGVVWPSVTAELKV